MHQTLTNLEAGFNPRSGFFRSSIASGIGGVFAGGSVIATALNDSRLELRAALATLLTAAAVAAADYLTRRRREREHEERFLAEHAKTRAALKRVNRPRKKVKNNG